METRNLTLENTVNDFVQNASREVLEFFRDHQIDTCCGGNKSLAAACQEQGLAPEAFLQQLKHLEGSPEPAPGKNPEDMAPTELIDHILEQHHRYLKEELPKLPQVFKKILQAHSTNHPELNELNRLFNLLKDDLLPHMEKEERVLFPMIKALATGNAPAEMGCGSVSAPIRVMRMEHQTALDLMQKMNELTNHYQVPEDGCNTYEHLYFKLKELEANTLDHIAKENDILFEEIQSH